MICVHIDAVFVRDHAAYARDDAYAYSDENGGQSRGLGGLDFIDNDEDTPRNHRREQEPGPHSCSEDEDCVFG